MQDFDNFTRAYLECALWAETGDDGQPFDQRYTLADFSAEAVAAAVADCAAFQSANAADIETGRRGRRLDAAFTVAELAGHDFWLTRNRHGAGFWDGDWADGAGERLTASADGFGERDIYVGDDGRLYFA
jgi:hypothetical protein